jgi:hypothetical protein
MIVAALALPLCHIGIPAKSLTAPADHLRLTINVVERLPFTRGWTLPCHTLRAKGDEEPPGGRRWRS